MPDGGDLSKSRQAEFEESEDRTIDPEGGVASDNTDFHLFVSYTRTLDAALAQEVERFLQSFHTVQPPGGSESLPPLRICVDGSHFSMPPVAEREGGARQILDVVYAHLARARELLALCWPGAARSEWVDKEIR